jgi:membrane protease YdiL (CAAX protease family)
MIPRVQALGRSAAFLCLTLMAQFVCASVVPLIAGRVLAFGIAATLSSLFATKLVMAWFHARPWPDVGARWNVASLRNLALGVGTGFVAAVAGVVTPIAAGAGTWRPDPVFPASMPGMALVTLSFAGVAFGEELYFRGYALQNLIPCFGAVPAVAGLGLLFGFAHTVNPGATQISTLNTVLWGIVLGIAMLRSRDLYFPIGIHFAWNWMLTLVGLPVSGFTMGTTGWRVEWRVDPLWSGGAYGPEGGLMNTLLLPLLAAVLLWVPVKPQRLPLVEPKEDP